MYFVFPSSQACVLYTHYLVKVAARFVVYHVQGPDHNSISNIRIYMMKNTIVYESHDYL